MQKKSYRDKWEEWGMATILWDLMGYRVKKTYTIDDLIKAARFWNVNNELKDRLEETYKHVECDEQIKELQKHVIHALTWGYKRGGE